MDLSYLYQPSITSGVAAAIASLAFTVFAWQARATLQAMITQLRRATWNRNGFFWTVNIIFMAVSVLHAGVFFGITGNGHDIPGIAQYLGFAVSLFLDLVTIILMQALLEAKYRSETQRARQFLLFIVITCATSTFANLAISLNDFDASKVLPHAPMWIQIASPYVLSSFPLFVILMSVAAEMIINVRPMDSLNEDEYEADEKKRIRLLQIRNDYLQKQADEELRSLQIRATMAMNKRLRSGKLPRSFRWFWEKPIDIDAVVAGVESRVKAMYAPQIEELQRRLEEVQSSVNEEHVEEVFSGNDGRQSGTEMEVDEELKAEQPAEHFLEERGTGEEVDTEPEMEVMNITPFHQRGTSKGTKTSTGVRNSRKSLTVAQAADYLGCTERYIRELRKKGTLETCENGQLAMASIKSYKDRKSAKV